jgi:hypothetical protein
MEHDEGSAPAARELVQVAATATVASSIGMARATLVQNLINDIDGQLHLPTAVHFNLDEQIGKTKELRLTPSHVVKSMARGEFEETLLFSGGDGGGSSCSSCSAADAMISRRRARVNPIPQRIESPRPSAR